MGSSSTLRRVFLSFWEHLQLKRFLVSNRKEISGQRMFWIHARVMFGPVLHHIHAFWCSSWSWTLLWFLCSLWLCCTPGTGVGDLLLAFLLQDLLVQYEAKQHEPPENFCIYYFNHKQRQGPLQLLRNRRNSSLGAFQEQSRGFQRIRLQRQTKHFFLINHSSTRRRS